MPFSALLGQFSQKRDRTILFTDSFSTTLSIKIILSHS